MCCKKDAKPFVECTQVVVYCISLSCGQCYIGQTGCLLNDCLRQHANLMHGSVGSHTASQCSKCKCTPMFDDFQVTTRYGERKAQEIHKAFLIHVAGKKECMSAPSVKHLNNEYRDNEYQYLLS